MDKFNEASMELSEHYKTELMVYERVVKKQDTFLSDSSEIHCRRLVGYNTSGDQVVWLIYSPNGKRLYASGIFDNNDIWTLDLSTLNLAIGAKFRISCMAPSFTGTMDNQEILTYTPNSNATAYYQFYIDSHKLKLNYNGVVPPYYYPDADPYLRVSTIIVNNSSGTLTRFALYSLDGSKLFESELFAKGGTFKLNVKDTHIEANTLFKVKAVVSAGSDSTCEVIMQYIPKSYYVGQFELYGTTFDTTLVYKGSYSLIPDTSKVVNANEIMVYNDSSMGANFTIILLDGTKIYESDKKYQWEDKLINLDNLNLESEMYVRLKVILSSNDLFSDIFIKYIPNAGTAYYKLVGKVAVPSTHDIYYYDVLSPEATPPLIRCSQIVVHNYSNMITKWSFISEEQTIFTSSRCRIGNTSTLNLNRLSLTPGTRFLLKANAIAGKDAIAYVTVEYVENSNITAQFEFDGPTNKTILMYEGSDQLVSIP